MATKTAWYSNICVCLHVYGFGASWASACQQGATLNMQTASLLFQVRCHIFRTLSRTEVAHGSYRRCWLGRELLRRCLSGDKIDLT